MADDREPETTYYDDTVTIEVTVQIPIDDPQRDQYAAEVAQQYQAAMWQVDPVHGRLGSVNASLPDWQPTSTVNGGVLTIAPRLRVTERAD